MEKIRKIISVIKFILLDKINLKMVENLDNGDYFIDKEIPYQCQFATPNLVADILENKIKAEDDPNWKIFDFSDKKEYAYWSLRICGIACFKMILDFYNLSGNKTIAELTNEGVKLGGYDIKTDKGWVYKSLLEQAKIYNLKGYIASYFGINSICNLILNKKFFIASVNPSLIRFDKIFPISNKEPGGHLALVIGFKINNGKIAGFFLNNPSGKSEETRKKAFIPINIFNKAYSKKGIAIWQ